MTEEEYQVETYQVHVMRALLPEGGDGQVKELTDGDGSAKVGSENWHSYC